MCSFLLPFPSLYAWCNRPIRIKRSRTRSKPRSRRLMALGHTQAMVSGRRPLEDAGKPACSWAVAVSSRWPDPVGSCRRLSQLASLWYLWVSSGLRPSITGLSSEWWWPYPVEAGETSGVWAPGSGRTLGTCPSVRWGTREPTCSGVSGWRMTSSQPTPKLITLKKETLNLT